MERCSYDETKLWEKTRERTATEMLALRQARWNTAVPQEAIPYIHNVANPEELYELGEALKQCMPLMEYIQALTQLRKAYGSFFDASGLKTRRPLAALATSVA